MCYYCRQEIPDGQEVLAISAKPMPSFDIEPHRGRIIEIPILTLGRSVPVMVAGRGSQAAGDGKDLLFMLCSDSCADRSKEALEREIHRGEAST